MKRSILILVLLLPLAVLFIGRGGVPGSSRGHTQQVGVFAGSSHRATGPVEAGASADMIRYAMQFSTVATTQGSTEPMTLAFAIRGGWTVRLAETTRTTRTYEVRLDSPRLELGAAVSPADLARIQDSLAAPHYAVFKRSGALETLLVDPQTDPTTYRVWFALAAAMQFTPGEGEEWTAAEPDAAGDFLVEYQRLDADHFEKRKLSYQTLRGIGRIDQNKISVALDGALQITRTAVGWPERVHGEEVASSESQGMVAMRVTTAIDMQRVETGSDDGGAAARLLSATGLVREIQPAVNAGPATASDYKTLIATLKAGTTDPSLLITGFATAFTDHPSTIAEAVRLLKSAPETDRTFAIAAALGDAGTPAAQAALVELATDDAVSPQYAEHAVMELGRTAAPTDDSINALKGALDHKRRAHAQVAALALGNAADARDSEELVAELAGRLDRATRPDEVVNLLLALGNTAHAAAFPPVSARLREPNPAIRSTAADSLRLLPNESATLELITMLANDVDETVRAAAASALSRRPAETTVAALQSAAQSDAAPSVRSEAKRALAKLSRTAAR